MGIILKDATTLGYLETKRNWGFPDLADFAEHLQKQCAYVSIWQKNNHIDT